MASAAVQLDEKTLIREFIAQLEMPPGVKFKRIEDEIDSTGEPALRIYFSVSKKIELTESYLDALNALTDRVQRKVFDLKLPQWPFVSFLDAR